jgi:hypothetical protein
MKIYNQMLSDAYDSSKIDTIEFGIPDWLSRAEIKFRKPPKIDLVYDLKNAEILEILAGSEVRKVSKKHQGLTEDKSGGAEVLAFYKPYCVSKKIDKVGWGIHYNFEAITTLALESIQNFRVINPDLTFGELVQIIFEFVRRHEIEHAAVEILGAVSQLKNREATPKYLEHINNIDMRRLSEILATQLEMVRGLNASKVSKEKGIPALLMWSNLPLPNFYREWNEINQQQVENDISTLLGLLQLGTNLSDIRNQMGTNGVSRFVAIPKYYWFGSMALENIPTHHLRTVFDCKKLSKFLQKNHDRSPFGVRLQITKSPDHDFHIVSERSARPIKFACHAWREVPEMVIGQLSEAFGAQSKNEFKKFLAQEI